MPLKFERPAEDNQESISEGYTEVRAVYYKPSQVAELETWLRANRPGTRVGAFSREATMRAIEADTSQNTITLYLETEQIEQLKKKALELFGQKDLADFAETLLLRALQRTDAEVTRFVSGIATAESLDKTVRELVLKYSSKQRQEDESDEKTQVA